MRRYLYISILVFSVFSILVLGNRLAVAGQEPRFFLAGGAPTVVSYQGRVTVEGIDYSGTGYFKFAVVDSSGTLTYWSNDGTSTYATEPTNSVALLVSNGLFNVLLGDSILTNMTALPASAFEDPDRYLRVWFSTDDMTYTHLNPDQRITSVPFALQAQEAQNADTLDNLHANAFMQEIHNVIVVAKGGGDFVSIQAALDSITDASVANPYLVWVAPGVYTEQVTMKPYVVIEGAGDNLTTITYPGSDTYETGTVIGADDSELRRLTVENTGGFENAIAVYNSNASPRLMEMTATAAGGTYNIGVNNDRNVSLMMKDVRISTTGGEQSVAIANFQSTLTMTNVTAIASGGDSNQGVNNNYASMTLTNVNTRAEGTNSQNYGIRNYSASAVLINVTANGVGGSTNFGVYNHESAVEIHNCFLSAAGEGNSTYGLFNTAFSPTNTYTVTLNGSQVSGTAYAIFSDSEHHTYVGDTWINGVAYAQPGGSLVCAGVYDEAYTFYPNTCP